MRVDTFTIFPGLVRAYGAESLLGKAVAGGLVDLRVHDLREHGIGRHRQVDDTVFGGGPGMVLRPDVVASALDAAGLGDQDRRLVLTPAGRRLDQAFLHELAGSEALTLLCGRYEGVDQRVLDAYGFEGLSIGDYVVAGGEVAALVVLEGVTRLLPGVMGNVASASSESFEDGLLEPPVFTRPAQWRERAVPDVLLSGNHAAIAAWRRSESIRRSAAIRPDLVRDALGAGLVRRDELEAVIGTAATIDAPRPFEESP